MRSRNENMSTSKNTDPINNSNTINNDKNNNNNNDKNNNNNNNDKKDIDDMNDQITKWDELEIPTELLRGIYAYGFEEPSPIQRKAIKPILTGRDVIAQAQSGTGKTATFAIGGLSTIDLSNKNPQVLCLSPTRELTIQTAKVVKQLGSMMIGLNIVTLVGGSSIDNDMKNLRNQSSHFIAGCPGRVNDIFRRNPNIAKDIKMVILDEADEILSSGFEEQVYNIFQYLNKDIQVIICSATMPNHMKYITDQIMNNPIQIFVKAEQLTLEGISQYYIAVDDDSQKYETLKDLYSTISVSQSIIYANSVRRVAELHDALHGEGFPVCCIHSGMSKEDREISLSKFRSGGFRVLISSNVTARGIDIQQVSVVINFDIPRDISTYLHRIGRSGRWGRKGMGINMITRRDVDKLREIEQFYSTQIDEMPSNISVG